MIFVDNQREQKGWQQHAYENSDELCDTVEYLPFFQSDSLKSIIVKGPYPMLPSFLFFNLRKCILFNNELL